MRADKATQAVLKDLAKEHALTRGHEDIGVIRAVYDRVFSAWTAMSEKPTREDWVDIGSTNSKGLIVEPVDVAPSGTILFIHGGGWSLGNALCYAPLCRLLAIETGLRVLAPDFPQAPEAPYPAALDMLLETTRWADRHYDGPLFLSGDSAGGTLCAVIAAELSDEAPIAGQALFYPVLDLRPDAQYRSRRKAGSGKYFLSEAGILGAAAGYCGENGNPASPKLSPILEPNLKRLPDTFLLVPDLDPLRDECERYGALLRKAGVKVDYVRARDTIHGCVSFSGRILQGLKGLKSAAQFLKNCAE